MRAYPVTEYFLSVQGEGLWSGMRAFFVRLAGCPVKCPWCDTKNSWQMSTSEKMTAAKIASLAEKSRAERLIITGGEPCMHNLEPLILAVRKKKIKVHLETSGVCELLFSSENEEEKKNKKEKKLDWLTLSPKFFAPPKNEFWKIADEVKFVISEKPQLEECLKLSKKAKAAKAIWLHPEWGKSKDAKLLSELANFVEKNGDPFRLGWQLHKNYSVR